MRTAVYLDVSMRSPRRRSGGTSDGQGVPAGESDPQHGRGRRTDQTQPVPDQGRRGASGRRAINCERPPGQQWWPMGVDSPDVVIATRLLDQAKLRGFAFWRAAPGEDGPLVGHRVSGDWVDVLHIAGFSRDCLAVRQRTSSLILLGGALVERRVEGGTLEVLNEVLTWEPPP